MSVWRRRLWLGALPLLCMNGTVSASPYCHGCTEGDEAIAQATRAFTGEVASFDDQTWTFEVVVEELFLGDPSESRITLAPNPMSSCHPKIVEPGTRWLFLVRGDPKLPTCTRAMVPLHDEGTPALIASLKARGAQPPSEPDQETSESE
jgi:hypothetical protein